MNDEKAPLVLPQYQKPRSWLKRDCCPCIPARYVLAVMSSIGFMNVYALRVNLSVAIVEMSNDTATLRNRSARVFDWNTTEQGWVLAAFFYGYLITQIPGGLLAQRVGGKWVFGVGVVMTAILTLFTPLAAYTSVWLLVAVRVLEGFFEGVTFPAMHAMWGKWAPPLERTKLGTITYTGPYIGSVISFPLSAVLCQYGFDGGWPSVFYVFGAVGILWFFAWIFLAYSSPATHPRISKEEKEYIESSIAAGKSTERKHPTPWLKILTSPAVWAIVIAHTCSNWGFYTLLTCMPTYFAQALPDLGLSTESIVLNGVYSAIPYTLFGLLALTSGQMADFMRARCRIPTVIVRKVFTSAAFVGSATFLLICGYLGTTTVTAVTFLTLGVGLGGLALAGFAINHLDIAPMYAGLLMGLTNTAATLPGIVGPQVAKVIAAEPDAPKHSDEYLNTYQEEWREVFIIAAEVYFFGTLIYFLLGSGKRQPWADAPEMSDVRRAKISNKTETSNEKVVSNSWELDKQWKLPNTLPQNENEANSKYSLST